MDQHIETRSQKRKNDHIFLVPQAPAPKRSKTTSAPKEKVTAAKLSTASNNLVAKDKSNAVSIKFRTEQDPIKIAIKERIFNDYIETSQWDDLVSAFDIKMLEMKYSYSLLNPNEPHDFLLLQKHNEIFFYWQDRTQSLKI
jgi:hypothetical protein